MKLVATLIPLKLLFCDYLNMRACSIIFIKWEENYFKKM